MYSMVLMAALTTGASAPDCHFRASYGCGGCYGGCYGRGQGCWGGCYGGSGYGGYGNAHGCWGGYGNWFGSCSGYTVIGEAVETKDRKAKQKKEAEEEDAQEDQRNVGPSKAKVIVDVPADARLFIDDQPMKSTSVRRVFTTPALTTGQAYYYDLRVEVVRDGEKLTRSKRVVLRAGQEIRANFQSLDSAGK